MTQSPRSRRTHRSMPIAAATAASVLALGAVSAFGSGLASADDGDFTIPLSGTAHATTTVAKLNNTITFGSAPVHTTLTVSPDAEFTDPMKLGGTLVLPQATTRLAVGPVNLSTITLTVAHPSALSGTATYAADASGINLDVTQSFAVKIDSIAPLGIGSTGSGDGKGLLVGNRCETDQTSARLQGKLEPADDAHPDIFVQGTLRGTYAIPQFHNCGVLTPVLNALVSGPGNALNVDLQIPYEAADSSRSAAHAMITRLDAARAQHAG